MEKCCVPCEISSLNVYEVKMQLQTGLGPKAGTFKAIFVSTINKIIFVPSALIISFLFLVFILLIF